MRFACKTQPFETIWRMAELDGDLWEAEINNIDCFGLEDW